MTFCAKLTLVVVWLLPAYAGAATNTLQVFGNDFGTNSAHVDPVINLGDTVTWMWAGFNHSTTAAAGQLESWDSGVHSQPFSFSHTFNEIGTFNYFCSIHGSMGGCSSVTGMRGKIIVVLAGAISERITSIERETDNVRVIWITGGLCKTNILQRATGDATGSYTNEYIDIFGVTNTTGLVTNYLDVGAASNSPARYYRVRLVP